MLHYFIGATLVAALGVGIAYFRGGRDPGSNGSATPPSKPQQPPPDGSTFRDKPPRGSDGRLEPRRGRAANARLTGGAAQEIKTTDRHLWLLGLAVGDVVTDSRLATELGIEPALGWHDDRSITLAVLVKPGSFYAHASGMRLRISPTDYRAASMPPISHQAVPILSACDNGWRFEGLFRLGHPRKTSVACDPIDGAPPELQDLKKSRDGGNR